MRPAVPVLFLALACREVPTETVSRCHPAGADCDAFLTRSAESAATVGTGEAVYASQCASCHGKDGRGMGIPSRGDFTVSDWQGRWTDADLQGIVTAGRGGKMPAFRLPPIELRSVVLFIRSLDPARGASDAPIKAQEGQFPYATEETP